MLLSLLWPHVVQWHSIFASMRRRMVITGTTNVRFLFAVALCCFESKGKKPARRRGNNWLRNIACHVYPITVSPCAFSFRVVDNEKFKEWYHKAGYANGCKIDRNRYGTKYACVRAGYGKKLRRL